VTTMREKRRILLLRELELQLRNTIYHLDNVVRILDTLITNYNMGQLILLKNIMSGIQFFLEETERSIRDLVEYEETIQKVEEREKRT